MDTSGAPPEPGGPEDFLARYVANQRTTGYGIETVLRLPCFFCAAEDFIAASVLEIRHALEAGATCRECGRSARALTLGASFELIQTGGPDQPAWREPKMRGIFTER